MAYRPCPGANPRCPRCQHLNPPTHVHLHPCTLTMHLGHGPKRPLAIGPAQTASSVSPFLRSRGSVHNLGKRRGLTLHQELPGAKPPEPCILLLYSKFHVSSVQRSKCSWWSYGGTRAGEVAGLYLYLACVYTNIHITHMYESINVNAYSICMCTALTSRCEPSRSC